MNKDLKGFIKEHVYFELMAIEFECDYEVAKKLHNEEIEEMVKNDLYVIQVCNNNQKTLFLVQLDYDNALFIINNDGTEIRELNREKENIASHITNEFENDFILSNDFQKEYGYKRTVELIEEIEEMLAV